MSGDEVLHLETLLRTHADRHAALLQVFLYDRANGGDTRLGQSLQKQWHRLALTAPSLEAVGILSAG